jgi:hypothetical protein
VNTQSDARQSFSPTSVERGAAKAAQPDALREVIHGMLYCALRSGVSDIEVHESMRRACAIARQEGVQPEYLLVGLKRTWREIPEVRRMLRDARENTLSGLISLCIEEYYAPLRGSRVKS